MNIQHQEFVYGFTELLVLEIHHFPVPLSKQCVHMICQFASGKINSKFPSTNRFPEESADMLRKKKKNWNNRLKVLTGKNN